MDITFISGYVERNVDGRVLSDGTISVTNSHGFTSYIPANHVISVTN